MGSLEKLKRSIEQMPRAPYIFLKVLLLLSDGMLTASALLFPAARSSLPLRHLACYLSESPAGVLLLGLIGLAFLLDRTL